MLLSGNVSEWKAPMLASLALAFASFGDAFLYPFLPVNSNAAGVPLAWVGLLLSVNRFVRIFSNGWMVHVFVRYGSRAVMTIAVCLALISTAGYAFASSLLWWLLLRIGWGLSFSALRMGTLGHALQHPRPALALGITRSVQEAGPMIALLFAPLLMNNSNIHSVFLSLAVLSLPALFFAWKLPGSFDESPNTTGRKFLSFPSRLDLITLLCAIVVDGIMIVVLGILFLRGHENMTLVSATVMAAFYLGYRRVCLVLFSPAGGWIADKVGIDCIFTLSLTMVIGGLFILISGYTAAGAVVVFTCYSVNVAITPAAVARACDHSMPAVAANASWRDVGAAVGTLLGGFFVTSSQLPAIIATFTLGLLMLFFIHLASRQNVRKLLYLWK